MAAWMLAGLQGTCAALAFAACAAMARDARGAWARRSWCALGVAPFLLFHLYLAVLACVVRFDLGAHSAPWVPAFALLALHVLAVAWIWKRVVGAEPASTVRALPLAFGALVTLVLTTATLSNLELRGRLVAATLSIEAGRLSYSAGAPHVDVADNAAPIYERHIQTLGHDEQYDLDDWSKYASGEEVAPERPFDPNDPVLRARLESWAPILADVRMASRLPHCRFEEPKDAYTSRVPSAIPLLDMTRALTLEARMRAARGDVRGAFEDLAASARIAGHVSETPSMMTSMLASVMLDATFRAVVNVLGTESITIEDMTPLEPWIGFSVADALERALTMERAFGLGILGEAFGGASEASAEFLGTGFQHDLYRAVMFEGEVASYRALTAEFEAVALRPLEELSRFEKSAEDDYGHRVRTAGLLPRLMVWGRVERLITLHATDARNALVRLAVAAKLHQLEHGRLPTSAAELGGVPATVVVEGDGTFVLLRDTRTAFEKPVEVRLPPFAK